MHCMPAAEWGRGVRGPGQRLQLRGAHACAVVLLRHSCAPLLSKHLLATSSQLPVNAT